jgi:hypothetical protein
VLLLTVIDKALFCADIDQDGQIEYSECVEVSGQMLLHDYCEASPGWYQVSLFRPIGDKNLWLVRSSEVSIKEFIGSTEMENNPLESAIANCRQLMEFAIKSGFDLPIRRKILEYEEFLTRLTQGVDRQDREVTSFNSITNLPSATVNPIDLGNLPGAFDRWKQEHEAAEILDTLSKRKQFQSSDKNDEA